MNDSDPFEKCEFVIQSIDYANLICNQIEEWHKHWDAEKLVIVSTGLNNGGAERVLFNFLAHIPDEQRRRIILVSCGGQQ